MSGAFDQEVTLKTLAGTALLGFVVAGAPLNASADAVELTVKLSMQNSTCTADIDGGKRVSYSKQDVLVFSFHNDCGKDQAVLVCAVPEGTTTNPAPWGECEGLPKSQPAMIGKEFPLLKATTANALCNVHWPNPAGNFTGEDFTVHVSSTDSGGDQCLQYQGFFAWFRRWLHSLVGGKLAPEIALEVDP